MRNVGKVGCDAGRSPSAHRVVVGEEIGVMGVEESAFVFDTQHNHAACPACTAPLIVVGLKFRKTFYNDPNGVMYDQYYVDGLRGDRAVLNLPNGIAPLHGDDGMVYVGFYRSDPRGICGVQGM